MISIACCIWWSTDKGMKFLNHGAVKSLLAPWVVQSIKVWWPRNLKTLQIINVWSQRCLGGSIAHKDGANAASMAP